MVYIHSRGGIEYLHFCLSYEAKERGPMTRGYNWATLLLEGIKYGEMAHQIGGVSDETIIYGYGSFANLISE
jgi:hypothetical protein